MAMAVVMLAGEGPRMRSRLRPPRRRAQDGMRRLAGGKGWAESLERLASMSEVRRGAASGSAVAGTRLTSIVRLGRAGSRLYSLRVDVSADVGLDRRQVRGGDFKRHLIGTL